jgi:hypothetical protein
MATIPPAALERRLNGISKRLNRGVAALTASIIEEIGNEVVDRTPVVTGFARANWRPSLNAPSSSAVSFLDPTGAATKSRIVVVGLRWQPGDIFYLVNRAPYIGRLAEGSSPQAPAGYVQTAARVGLARGFARNSGDIL